MSTALATVQQESPLAILQAALDRGTDPAKLEKLMDLAERWKADRAAEEYAAAMCEAQRAMPNVVRDAENSHTRSRYARLETVSAVIKPVYTQHGFALSFGQERSDFEGHIRIICDVSHTGGHSRRYYLDCPIDGAGVGGKANKTGIQAMGSTISYGRRYLCLMIFNVTVADHDNDGNAVAALGTIDGEQIEQIEAVIREKGINEKRFLEWCGVSTLDQIRGEKFAHVMRTLESYPKGGAA